MMRLVTLISFFNPDFLYSDIPALHFSQNLEALFNYFKSARFVCETLLRPQQFEPSL